MDNALRTNVAETACCHLAIDGIAHGVELLIVGLGAIVRHHHSVGDD